MSGITHKLASATIVLLISWIVAYGAGNAQLVCCMAAVDRCQPAAKGMTGRTPCLFPCTPSHRSKTPQPNGCSSTDASIRYNSGVACCDITPCEDTGQATYVLASSPEPHSMSGIMPCFENSVSDVHIPYVAKKSAIPFQTVPIYIQKSAFLC